MVNTAELQTQDLGNGITCIDTGYTRPGMTACYLIQQGDYAGFIETGVNRNVPGLLSLLERKGIALERVSHIMPTHVHLDHAGGVGALMQALPNARLMIHPRGARHMIDPGKLVAGTAAVYGEEKFAELYGELIPVSAERVTEVNDGYELDFHGRILRFIDTPGHARHHYCVYDGLSKGIFTGDTMGLSYPELCSPNIFSLPTTTPVQFDPQALHDSIDKLMAINPERLYLTHYGVVEQLEDHAKQLHEDIDEYVELVEKIQPAADVDVLADALSHHLLGRLKRSGSKVEEALARQVLHGDVQLNAQGLICWMQSR